MKIRKSNTLWVLLCLSWLTFMPAAHAQHGLIREVYTNIFGGVQALTNDVNFPGSPSRIEVLPQFEAPQNDGNFYGQRVRGYLLPPATGDYVFWIASDDGSRLFLSTDENPANKVEIAGVETWVGFREWSVAREPNQQSAPIQLEEGKRYYVEALTVDGTSSDHLTVRWQLPDGQIEEPIPGERLLAELIPPRISRQPESLTVVEGGSASFRVEVGNLGPVHFQWQRNGQSIPGETNATYSRMDIPLSAHGSRYRVVVTNLFGKVTSNDALLRVNPDVTPPTVVSALNPGDPQIVTVRFSKKLDRESATDIDNYRIDQGIDVLSARLHPDLRTVVLETTPLTFGSTYLLVVNDVEDTAATPNRIAPETAMEFTYGFTPVPMQVLKAPPEPIGPSTRRTGLVISEIMHEPASRSDNRNVEYVELYNSQPVLENLGGYRLSGAIEYTFPPGAFIAAGGYLVVAQVPSDVQEVYGLSRVFGGFDQSLPNRGVIRLHNAAGAILLEAVYDNRPPYPASTSGAGHSLVLARPSYGERQPHAWAQSASFGGSPGKAEPATPQEFRTVVINEFLANSDDPELDFVELYNYGPVPVDISGCYLTDTVNTNRFQIPNGTVLPSLGYIAFTETDLGFALSSSGETVYLINPQQSRVLDSIRFEATAPNRSSGRCPDGSGSIVPLQELTMGASNSEKWRAPVVINEIMFHPLSNSANDEYIELYNRSSEPVDLSGWKVAGGIRYTIPNGVLLMPDSYLVLAENPDRILTNYPHLDSDTVLGGYDGRLSNAGERLELREVRVEVVPDAGGTRTNTLEILHNAVSYRDGGRWGTWADGGGSSLELIDPEADNSLAANWADSDETTKAGWTTIEHTGLLDHGMTNFLADDLHVLMLGPGEALLDDVEVIYPVDGTNLVRNSTFEQGFADWAPWGNHAESTLAPEGFESDQSLHVRTPHRGDTAANRITGRLTTAVPNGETATIRAKVRWLKGHPEILLRFHGNYLEATGRLETPANLGTPGLPNSRLQENSGPAIADVLHSPILPAANQQVEVTARIDDPDKVASAVLHYRLDPATNLVSVSMTYRGAGLYSGWIPPQPAGQMVAFHIEASDTSGASALFPADNREAMVLFGDTRPGGSLGTYRFWVSQENVDHWASRHPSTNHRLDMTFVYGDYRVIYNGGADYSGSPWHWRGFDHPITDIVNYVFIAPKDDLFLGVTDFVINVPGNLTGNDPTAIREQIFYWMAKDLKHPYNHRRFHYMFFNGVRQGAASTGFIMEDAQQPNREVVEAWFPDSPDGELFKLEDWFEFNESAMGFNNVDATLENFVTTSGEKKKARYRWTFRKRAVEDSANDYDSLFRLVDAVNIPASDAYTAAVESTLDVDEWMLAFALRHMAGDWDSYGYDRGKNMYAYKPQDDKWQLLHWDIGFVFGTGHGTTHDIFDSSKAPMVTKMLDHPPFRRAYLRALKKLVDGPMQASRVNPTIDALHQALVANNISVAPPDDIKNWIAARRSYIQSQLAGAVIPFGITSNGGADFSTNRNLITLTGTAAVDITTITVNGVPFPVTWTTPTSWAIHYPLPARSNTLTVQGLRGDGSVAAGATGSITVTFIGSPDSPAGKLVINELMYHPVNGNAEFIEIHNLSKHFTFDLAGYRLDGLGFEFEAGTAIEPGGFAVLAKDYSAFAGAYGPFAPLAGFYDGSLNNAGERIQLLRPEGTNFVVIDSVTYSDMSPWPVAADGQGPSLQLIDAEQDNARAGNWTAAPASPAAPNSGRAKLSTFPLVWLNEVQPDPSGGIDNEGEPSAWVELYNSSSEPRSLDNLYLAASHTNLLQWQFPAGSTIAAGERLLVWLDREAHQTTTTDWHANFQPAPDSGTIILSQLSDGKTRVADFIRYSNLAPDQTAGALPEGQAETKQIFFVPTPGRANEPSAAPVALFINEWMAANSNTLQDPADGNFEDWFEIYNAGSSEVDLSGFFLSDKQDRPEKFTIPEGFSIPANGYLLVWADEDQEQTVAGESLHVNFRLGRGGESILLSDPNGQVLDQVVFGEQTADVSQGRIPDGDPTAELVFMEVPTPGSANQVPVPNAAPVLRRLGGETVLVGSSLQVDAEATDPDEPQQQLQYSIRGAPAGMQILAETGLISWTPTAEHAGQTFEVTVVVTDNGNPPRSDEAVLTIQVLAEDALVFSGITIDQNQITLAWRAQAGVTYQVQYKDSLSDPDWTLLQERVASGATESIQDPVDGRPQRFYRIVEMP